MAHIVIPETKNLLTALGVTSPLLQSLDFIAAENVLSLLVAGESDAAALVTPTL